MGATVASLEEASLIERKPHPTDGRQLLIHITPKGRALRNELRDAKRHWLAQAISQLSSADRDTLFKAAPIIKRLAESDPQKP